MSSGHFSLLWKKQFLRGILRHSHTVTLQRAISLAVKFPGSVKPLPNKLQRERQRQRQTLTFLDFSPMFKALNKI